MSPREREVVRLIAGGKSSKEIGRVLAISPRTVDTCRNRLMEKLGLHSVADGAGDGGPGSVRMSGVCRSLDFVQ
ncbi:LuxR C-terminal-related transcriptional regulator [uncultured Lamprocystis sp.]|uniref:LuxR C-terminal-related transcriptional regulator n=1 Tax=uncultured Lamprocystis sp. TaxID=543132 RepID=UPI0025FCB429|nr:helix-turn-helix transcriptional regulator [uncultured Lamprocystis sp.]